MPYIIKTVSHYPKKNGTGTWEDISYFERGSSNFGPFANRLNIMTSRIEDAQQYETITEARRVKRMRFRNRKNVKIEKIP